MAQPTLTVYDSRKILDALFAFAETIRTVMPAPEANSPDISQFARVGNTRLPIAQKLGQSIVDYEVRAIDNTVASTVEINRKYNAVFFIHETSGGNVLWIRYNDSRSPEIPFTCGVSILDMETPYLAIRSDGTGLGTSYVFLAYVADDQRVTS